MREYIIETANEFDFVVVWLIAALTFHLFSFDGWFWPILGRKRLLSWLILKM